MPLGPEVVSSEPLERHCRDTLVIRCCSSSTPWVTVLRPPSDKDWPACSWCLGPFPSRGTGITKDTHSNSIRWARKQVFEEKERKETVSFAFSL